MIYESKITFMRDVFLRHFGWATVKILACWEIVTIGAMIFP